MTPSSQPLQIEYRNYLALLHTEIPEALRLPAETAIEIQMPAWNCQITVATLTWNDIWTAQEEHGFDTIDEAMRHSLTKRIDRKISETPTSESTTYKGYEITHYLSTPEAVRREHDTAARIHVPDQHQPPERTTFTWRDIAKARHHFDTDSTSDAVMKSCREWIDDNRALNRPRPHTLVEFAVVLLFVVGGLSGVRVTASVTRTILGIGLLCWCVALAGSARPALRRNTVKGLIRGAVFFLIAFLMGLRDGMLTTLGPALVIGHLALLGIMELLAMDQPAGPKKRR